MSRSDNPFRTPPDNRKSKLRDIKNKYSKRRRREDTPILPLRSVLPVTPPHVDTPEEKKKKPSFPGSNSFFSPLVKKSEGKKKKKKRKKKKHVMPGKVTIVKEKSKSNPSFPSTFGGTSQTAESFFDELSSRDEILDFTKEKKFENKVQTPSSNDNTKSLPGIWNNKSPNLLQQTEFGDIEGRKTSFIEVDNINYQVSPQIPLFETSKNRNHFPKEEIQQQRNLMEKDKSVQEMTSIPLFLPVETVKKDPYLNNNFTQENKNNNNTSTQVVRVFRPTPDEIEEIEEEVTSKKTPSFPQKSPSFPKSRSDPFSELFDSPQTFPPIIPNKSNQSQIPMIIDEISSKKKKKKKSIQPPLFDSPPPQMNSFYSNRSIFGQQQQQQQQLRTPETIYSSTNNNSNVSSTVSTPTSPQKAKMPMPHKPLNIITSCPPKQIRPISALYDFRQSPCPCFDFGFGGRIATIFPTRFDVYNNNNNNININPKQYHFQGDSSFSRMKKVRISPFISFMKKEVDSFGNSNFYEDDYVDGFFRFNGPLTNNSKINDIVMFLNKDILKMELKKSNNDDSDIIMDPSYADGLRFLEILRSITKFHGSEGGKLHETIAMILTISGKTIDENSTYSKFANEVGEFGSEDDNGDFPIEIEPVSITISNLKRLKEYMLCGNIVKAVDFAVKKKLWSHALFLSSMVSRERYIRTVRDYVSSSFLKGTPLHTLYSVFGGFGCEIFDDSYFFREGGIMGRGGEGEKKLVMNRLLQDRVFENLSVLLSNAVDGRRKFMLKLAKRVRKENDDLRVASDTIFLVISIFTCEEEEKDEFGMVNEPFGIIGSEYGSDSSSIFMIRPSHIRYTEVCHFVKMSMMNLEKEKYIRDYKFDKYLILYICWLLDLGMIKKAKQYLEYLEHRILNLSKIYINNKNNNNENNIVPPFLQENYNIVKLIKERIEFSSYPSYPTNEDEVEGGSILGFGFIKKGFSGIMGLVGKGGATEKKNEQQHLKQEEEEDEEEEDGEENEDINLESIDLQQRIQQNDETENYEIDTNSLWHSRNY